MPGVTPAPPTTRQQHWDFAQGVNVAVTTLGQDYLGGKPAWVRIVLLPRLQIRGHSIGVQVPGQCWGTQTPILHPSPTSSSHRCWQPLALTSLHWAMVRSPSTASTMQSATAAVMDSLISLGAERGLSGPASTNSASHGHLPRRALLRRWMLGCGSQRGSQDTSVCCQSRNGNKHWLGWRMPNASHC